MTVINIGLSQLIIIGGVIMKNQNLGKLTIEIKNKANQILSQISGLEKASLIYSQVIMPEIESASLYQK